MKLSPGFLMPATSSDGGLLLLQQAERKLGTCRLLAEALRARRDPDRIRTG
jgi:hypothetical protein